MHTSDDLFLGNAPAGVTAAFYDSESQLTGAMGLQSSPPSRGIGPCGRILTFDVLPVTLSAVNLRASSAAAAGGNLTLVAANNANVTITTNRRGETVWQFDCERNLTFTAAANETARTFTITGYDRYGVKMSATRTGPNATINATLKPFYQILSVAIDAASAGAFSIGVGDVYGLPVAVPDVAYIGTVKWSQTLAQDAGTFVAADATTATAATGAVRGTYSPSSASNGTRRLVMGILLSSLQAGPNGTQNAAIGVPQNLAGQ